MKRPEILSPAGNLEKLEFAIRYGADAVYAAGENFGLRSSAGNFSRPELEAAVKRVHSAEKKIYITANIFPHNSDIGPMKEYFAWLKNIGIDAVIISDIGVMSIIRETAPELPVHVSVQANNMNYMEVKAWQKLGAKRVVLARELPFDEIRDIREKCPDMELEIFVHGAICMSLSGRCLISNYLTARDANRGECSQSCRWSYSLVEEKRPGEYLPVIEDDRGTYIFNSKDLCAINELHRFIGIGIDSFKIEGRMKSNHYAAVTTAVYKKAVDNYMKDPANYKADPGLMDELLKVSHREFTDGLYFPGRGVNQGYKSSEYTSTTRYAGYLSEAIGNGKYSADVKATIKIGDRLEYLMPDGSVGMLTVKSIYDESGLEIVQTKHFIRHILKLESGRGILPYSIIRFKE